MRTSTPKKEKREEREESDTTKTGRPTRKSFGKPLTVRQHPTDIAKTCPALSLVLSITWRGAHRRVGPDEIEFRSCRVIRRHEQVRLVFIGGIRRRRLSGGRQSLEVELVRVPFAVHFAHNVLVVVVTANYENEREQ